MHDILRIARRQNVPSARIRSVMTTKDAFFSDDVFIDSPTSAPQGIEKGWGGVVQGLVCVGGSAFIEQRISWSRVEGQGTLFEIDRRKPQLCS